MSAPTTNVIWRALFLWETTKMFGAKLSDVFFGQARPCTRHHLAQQLRRLP